MHPGTELALRPAATMKLIGGHLALNFCNTVGGRLEAENPATMRLRADKLEEYLDLLAWAQHAMLLDGPETAALQQTAAKHPRKAQAVFERAKHLRETVYWLCRALMETSPAEPATLAAFNEALAWSGQQRTLVAPNAQAGRFRAGWTKADLHSPAALDSFLRPIIWSAAEVLTTVEPRQLKYCPSESCGWLFHDTSKAGRRVWCDMADCGTLIKVHRFRRHLRGAQD